MQLYDIYMYPSKAESSSELETDLITDLVPTPDFSRYTPRKNGISFVRRLG